MLRRWYDWMVKMAEDPRALYWLALVSFAESSFFPIPPDVMMVPMVLTRPQSAWAIAGVCTIASVLGGLLGYAIGYFFFETAGAWIIDAYGLKGGLSQFREQFQEWGLWIILIKGLTPIPYKLVTIASGAAQFDLTVFILASIVTRGARFFMVAALLHFFGEPVRHFIEKRLEWVTGGLLALIVGGFLALRLL